MPRAGKGGLRAGRCREAGVTLIELMIVVVVVGILASIAYPSYQQYILRSKRTEGKALLMDIVARQERFYMDRNSYTDDLTALGFSSAEPKSADGNYSASVAAGPSSDIATSYEVTVSPEWPDGDPECGALTLDSRGVQGSSVGTVERCWR